MKYLRLLIVACVFVALILWLRQRNTPDSSSITVNLSKPTTGTQVAKPVIAAINSTEPSASSPADLPANFDPRAKIAKDEMREYLQEMVQVANESLMPEREKEDPEIWIVSEEITALEYKYCLDAMPVLNDAGDVATFTVDSATWKQMKDLMAASKDPPKIIEPPSLRYVKINGEWQEFEEDPEKDPFADPSDYLPQLLHPELVIK